MRRFFLCSRVQSQFNPLRCCAFSAASAQLRSELDRAREEAADDIAWAKTPTAAAVLRQPPFLDSLDVGRIASGDALESLDAYLQVRFVVVCICLRLYGTLLCSHCKLTN